MYLNEIALKLSNLQKNVKITTIKKRKLAIKITFSLRGGALMTLKPGFLKFPILFAISRFFAILAEICEWYIRNFGQICPMLILNTPKSANPSFQRKEMRRRRAAKIYTRWHPFFVVRKNVTAELLTQQSRYTCIVRGENEELSCYTTKKNISMPDTVGQKKNTCLSLKTTQLTSHHSCVMNTTDMISLLITTETY